MGLTVHVPNILVWTKCNVINWLTVFELTQHSTALPPANNLDQIAMQLWNQIKSNLHKWWVFSHCQDGSYRGYQTSSAVSHRLIRLKCISLLQSRNYLLNLNNKFLVIKERWLLKWQTPFHTSSTNCSSHTWTNKSFWIKRCLW